jgi:hypothetical protein
VNQRRLDLGDGGKFSAALAGHLGCDCGELDPTSRIEAVGGKVGAGRPTVEGARMASMLEVCLSG